jgi:2,4-dienoyl-CoA reductase-like NADH-dependent reductase (Old Yellow Enzyme family)
MSALFSPYRLRDLTLRNRIVVSPRCLYSAGTDGTADDWHLMHILNLALSSAGMMCLEATAVTPEGRISPADLGLWDDAGETALERVVSAVRKYSNIALAIQLAHAGRKGSRQPPWEGGKLIEPSAGGWITHAPSAVAHMSGESPPQALERSGLASIKSAFEAAARRSARLGFDAIEIHAGHGYLIHQFLSPLSNQRTDEYGGSLANRMRFPLEVFERVRAAFPASKPVGVRLSAHDWVEGGWDLDQTIAVSKALKARGADWITASSGGSSPLQKIALGPGYQVPFAKGVKDAAGVATIAVGLITEPQQAEDIIANGQADLVALARAMLYDPRWPWHAAAALGATVEAPVQYLRSQPHGLKNLFEKAVADRR